MNASDRFVRRVERDTRGLSLTPEQARRVVAALHPCLVTSPVQVALTVYDIDREWH